MEKKIRFMKFYVTDGTTKARVFYSPCDNYGPKDCKRRAVTLYERGYDRLLPRIFGKPYNNLTGFDCPEYKNETDMQSDYFDEGNITLYEDHPLYQEALSKALEIQKDREAKRALKLARV